MDPYQQWQYKEQQRSFMRSSVRHVVRMMRKLILIIWSWLSQGELENYPVQHNGSISRCRDTRTSLVSWAWGGSKSWIAKDFGMCGKLVQESVNKICNTIKYMLASFNKGNEKGRNTSSPSMIADTNLHAYLELVAKQLKVANMCWSKKFLVQVMAKK